MNNKKFLFFYDESGHSRRITKDTIESENHRNNFVVAIIGYQTVTSFNLNIEVRSDTKVYYYRLSYYPYSGFDNFVQYL